jgi:hypothetical protein
MVLERIAWLMLPLIYGIARWGYQAIKNNFLFVIIFLVLLTGLIRVYNKLGGIEDRLSRIENDVNRRI